MLTVEPASAGARLDRWLSEQLTVLSRARLQELIRGGLVRVDGSVLKAAHRLRGGERVEVEMPPPAVETLAPEPVPLVVVYEDDDVLVVDKPAGMVVHPGAGVTRGTLVHALLHHDPGIAEVGGAGRPGIVHRLDKETSGLMVVARTPRAYRALVEALRAHDVRRVYRALVWGDPGADEGEIAGPIGRDPRRRQRMTVVRRGGKSALTRWRVLTRFGAVSLLEARLETGRTHQIRVHFAHLGMPVVGDPVYGGRGKKQLSGNQSQRTLAGALLDCLPRQALHASELALRHPVTGRPQRWTTPVPDDFARALDLLRLARQSRSR